MADEIRAKRVTLAKQTLYYQGATSKMHMEAHEGEEVLDMSKEDFADFMRRGLIETKLVEA